MILAIVIGCAGFVGYDLGAHNTKAMTKAAQAFTSAITSYTETPAHKAYKLGYDEGYAAAYGELDHNTPSGSP